MYIYIYIYIVSTYYSFIFYQHRAFIEGPIYRIPQET